MLARTLRWLGLWLLLVAPVTAQDVPPALRDWQGWVLHDMPQQGCPFPATQAPAADNRVCAWPGRLALEAGAQGGHFSLDVHVDVAGWVDLPGDARSWPQQVNVDAQAATVLPRDGVPAVWLAPGDHRLAGTLPWSTRPARLRVPESIGLVSLRVDGAPVARLERDGDQLTLGEAAAAQRAADALSLRVYRRLDDGLPATLRTQVQLAVAGSAREQRLGPVLPAGFIATALQGELPARLENDGQLRVQLRPGQWTLTLEARSAAPLENVALTLPDAPWPRQEIWSYADNPDLRGTRAEGHATDAAQAGVPDEWRELPAFVLDGDSGLAITQGSRGDEGGRGDQLHLRREMWLDFDGRGFSVVDNLSGPLRRRQRLDVAAPWQLQRASQAGDPLLVTRGDHGASGVELRDRQLALEAGLRLPAHRGTVPVSGWQVPLESVDASVHLPAGYRLLGAIGADHSPDSWVAQWSLLDLFVVALIALLAGRLLGWPWALLAAGYLMLAQHEAGAPLWGIAIVLALALLLRALPEGRLRATARIGAMAVLALAVLWTLPFAARQLQYALHPQLEGQDVERTHPRQERERIGQEEFVATPAPAPAVEAAASMAVPAPRLASRSSAKARVAAATVDKAADRIDPRSVIQAGAGMPRWDRGNNYRLGWSGPVTVEQGTRLVIAPAWLVRVLRVAMVLLLGLLLARMALALGAWRGGRGTRRRGAGLAATALLALAILPHGAHAQELPGQPLLDQLRQRLTEAPACAPDCAELAQAQLRVAGDALDVELEAHAGAAVALALPQADEALQLVAVTVDGRADAALARGDGALRVRLDRGVHRLGLRYRIGATDSASLHFPQRPQRVAFSGEGWSLDGVDEGRALGDSIALHRVRTAADGKDLPPSQSFPPYVRLTRTLVPGLDWEVRNVVERIAPQQGGFSITLPLLPGEHPQGDDARVSNGRISVTFNANSDTAGWTSRLDPSPRLALTAPALGERAETWQIRAAPMWHVEATGVPGSASDDGLRYQPLPGETLQLAFSQPAAVAGDSLAVDGVELTSTVGERATETVIVLQARSTRGGEHAIDLPAGAELLGAQRDGLPVNLAVRDGKLGLPLLPGAHAYRLRLREPHGVATRVRSPALALHAPVANIGLTLQLPQDRWVLWTWGPAAGPAVLYWSQLLVLLLAAWLLARFAPTPLRLRHWLLLGLGFSAFAWSAFALVVVWLILLGLRARLAPDARLGAAGFNAMQCGLGALTLLSLAVLVAAVPTGLLGLPDMHVAGQGSTAWSLHWFADQSTNALPGGGVVSVSLWVYKLAMLAWALWLANALIGWLRWGFQAWTHGGYWRKRTPKAAAAPPPQPPRVESSPDA